MADPMTEQMGYPMQEQTGRSVVVPVLAGPRGTADPRPSPTWCTRSHSHADHIGASSLLGSDVVRIGHSECRRLLLRDDDPNRPAPDITFEDGYEPSVGGELLLLEYHGPNHTPDNIFIYAPDYQTLMVVDVMFPGGAPFKNLAISPDIRTGSPRRTWR